MLRVSVNQTSNFIYHVLSVAGIGYDNAYGRAYRSLHKPDHLDRLKAHEDLLRVEGGQHCGRLYGLLVAKPACAESYDQLRYYYQNLHDLFSLKDPVLVGRMYPDLGDAFLDPNIQDWPSAYMFLWDWLGQDADLILDLVSIFQEALVTYETLIWPQVEGELLTYKRDLEACLPEDLESSWEKLLGQGLKDDFNVLICQGLEGGAQAIDISPSKDVFGIDQACHDLMTFISHEVGIYIIRDLLDQDLKDDLMTYWLALESLATYYNLQVLDQEASDFTGDNPYLAFYGGLEDQGSLSDMIRLAHKSLA